MATKLKNATVTLTYSNSDGSITHDLITYNVDTDFPGGAQAPLTERQYLLDLRPPEHIAPGGQFGPLSKLLLKIKTADTTEQTLDGSTVIEIPARKVIADSASRRASPFRFKASDFGLAGKKLLPGIENIFFYQADIIESFRLGLPSPSPTNMNNSTILMDLQKV